MNNYKAVSYTHLDVYKRQGQCNAMGSRAFSNTTGLYGGGEYTDENRRKVVAKACLLYTS